MLPVVPSILRPIDTPLRIAAKRVAQRGDVHEFWVVRMHDDLADRARGREADELPRLPSV